MKLLKEPVVEKPIVEKPIVEKVEKPIVEKVEEKQIIYSLYNSMPWG